MSKKHKNKFKKQEKARILREAMATANMSNSSVGITSNATVPLVATKVRNPEDHPNTNSARELLPEVKRVRTDVKKIGLIVLVLVMLLVAALIADQRFGWILKIADFAFNSFKN